MDKLTKAKAGLILDQPFFASLLLNMPLIEDKNEKTFATNGESIYYNPDFLAGMQQSEVTFVLAHEVLHAVFEHCLNIGSRNHNRWNQATDYVINQILTDERIGIMPVGGLLNPGLVKQGKETSEGVYELLPKTDESKNTGDKGGSLDSVKQPDKMSPADKATKSAEMKVKVLQAKQAAKMQGKLSAGLKRLVDDVTKTDTPWCDVLRRFLSERAKIDYSYSRPKRRFLAEDIYLPSLTGERLGCIDVAVDCSGSINPRVLGAFEKEIQAILQDTTPTMVRVLYFDTQVLKVETFGPDDTVKLSPEGGGGTMFSPVFEYINKSDIQPVACIVLTDLECNDFGSPPEYPVLWASTDKRNTAPWGEIVHIKVDSNV